MKYNVGDIVKIKPLEEIRKLMAFNKGPGRNDSMTPMCGKIYEIERINSFCHYIIRSEEGTSRNFLEEWLEFPSALFI